MRTTTASLLAVAAVTAALSPAAAHGAVKSGVYSGSHATGKVSFKLGTLSKRIVRVSGTAKLTCADGSTRDDKWDVVVFGPKPAGGKVTFRGDDIVLSATFLRSGRVKGTLDRTNGDCKVTGAAFTAKRG